MRVLSLLCVVGGAFANAAPCASAVDPSHAYLYPDDDNYAGSGREITAKPLKLPARRETAAYLLEKAAQCRRLAAGLVGDPRGEALIKRAEKFERRALRRNSRLTSKDALRSTHRHVDVNPNLLFGVLISTADPMPSSASATLQFTGLGESDAEQLLAAIWRVLEERGLRTPRVDIRSGNPSIDITLTFQSAEDRAAIEKNIALNVSLH